MSLEKSPVPIKTEPEDEACDVEFEYDEVRIKAEQALLYAGHQIKDEMVIGPTEIHRPPPGVDHSHWEAVRWELPNVGVDKEVAFLQSLYNSRVELRNAADELLCARCGQWNLTKERLLKHQQTACLGKNKCALELRYAAADELLCARCGQWSLTAAELHQHQTAHSTKHPMDCLEPNACTTHLGNGYQAIGPTEIRRPLPGPPKKAIRSTERHKGYQPKAKIPRTITEEPKPSTSLAPNETSEVTALKPTLSKTQTVVLDKGITDTQLQQTKTETDNDKYTCDGCGKDFTLKASLIAHIIGHDTKKNKARRVDAQDNGKQNKHSCDICDYTTDYERDLLRHLRIHSEDKPFACTLFPYNGATKIHFDRHLKRLTEGKAHSCSFCDYKSSKKQNMVVHVRNHTGDKRYECTYCTYKSAYKNNLRKHSRTHTGEKPYACSYCTSKFALKNTLETHIQTHTRKKPYACTYCTSKFAQKNHLETHIRTHTGEKPYACTYCTYKCAHKHYLERHIRTHTGEKPYACSYCTSKFAGKHNLERHIRTHTREKPYACTYCTYKCAHKHHLERHIRTHTGEKPYACSYCTSKFADKHNLETHIRTHTGEKPYACTYCTYKFAHKHHLERHIRTHTGEKPCS